MAFNPARKAAAGDARPDPTDAVRARVGLHRPHHVGDPPAGFLFHQLEHIDAAVAGLAALQNSCASTPPQSFRAREQPDPSNARDTHRASGRQARTRAG